VGVLFGGINKRRYSKTPYRTPREVLPYMGYIGICGSKGYGFSAVLVINRVKILADFGYCGESDILKLDLVVILVLSDESRRKTWNHQGFQN